MSLAFKKKTFIKLLVEGLFSGKTNVGFDYRGAYLDLTH